jgi:AAA15 family ATPase/GTPase
MKRVAYVEIENFKTFGKKIHIDLDHPAVLVGPNNAGKTSAIQAIALWSRGIKAWYEKKERPRKKNLERTSAGINRLNILEIPVSQTRFLWSETRVRKGNTPINMEINVGIEMNGNISDCRLIFTQRDSEVIYCHPCNETIKDEEVLKTAAGIRFNLLYPMSGIETEEPLIKEGRINVLMGQGQTAQVLRNLCYSVIETDRENNPDYSKPGNQKWEKIKNLMKKLFLIDLDVPQLDSNRGTLFLEYRQENVENALEIALAGRGAQQILLILAYLYSHPNSILMIDEPDAHLEILRQKQVFEILKNIAHENGCQVIIATHSEVILDDAVDTNLTLLIDGEAVNLARQSDMKNALRTFGIDHYYKAKILPRILYIEGSTDLDILKEMAAKLDHPAYDILNDRLNYYYIRDTNPADTLDSRLEKVGGAGLNYKQHFYTLKNYVPGFKGIAVFDSDGNLREDYIKDDLAVVYWQNYEIENYFISIDSILAYIEDSMDDAQHSRDENIKLMEGIIFEKLLSEVFNGDKSQLEEFRKASKNLKRTILKNFKMSGFAEGVFSEFANRASASVLLRKCEFKELIRYVEPADFPGEVTEKLDLIVKYLAY